MYRACNLRSHSVQPQVRVFGDLQRGHRRVPVPAAVHIRETSGLHQLYVWPRSTEIPLLFNRKQHTAVTAGPLTTFGLHSLLKNC
jgi:hypothetical protein